MKNIFIGVILLIVLSCGISRDVEEDVIRLMSEPLIVPTNSFIIISSIDTTINDFFSSNLKMVVYTNSESCSSCALNKLHMWYDIIQHTKPYKSIKEHAPYKPYYTSQFSTETLTLLLSRGAQD